jgi:uncharacterized membrane protein
MLGAKQGAGAKQEAGMDSFILVSLTFVAPMLIVGYLAHERGRSQTRWVWTAAVIGPLAIPLFYLVVAMSQLRQQQRQRG